MNECIGARRLHALKRLALAIVALAACSDDPGTKGDAGTRVDRGVRRDSGVRDLGRVADARRVSDGKTPDGGSSFVRELTLGSDDGVPAVLLQSNPGGIARTIYTPPAGVVPVQLRALRLLPAGSFSNATVNLHRDSAGAPGDRLGGKSFSVSAGEVGSWKSLTLAELGIVVSGPFWVVVTYPTTLTTPTQQVIYGAPSTAGATRYTGGTLLDYVPNFEQMQRVVVATANTATPQLAGDRAPCSSGIDCQSGYCLAGSCSIACTDDTACGSGRRCQLFKLSTKVCVTPCEAGKCAAGAICLRKDAFNDDLLAAADLCVRAGPLANGASCTGQYHTICAGGACSACATNPLLCDTAGGTCGAQ